ncbi:chalcone isomerase family protein [Inhella crocodyli]|jgi:hypothetical protein|uniref:Chalcone isomerase domain-containing protein n=1 Tax=Inhella crocodyli TaxID=2499851 RepID=A0A3S2WRG3_9BURK|nr:chalcone isomerase family protein [Inhella crocodyli]RVT86128.1 hypothetical protein EOD73_08800 [Inhella crocodyli]
MILRRAALTVLLSLALPFATQAQTVDAGGAKFETSAEVAGQKLVLNGAGVRYRAVFKVYAAGLYIKAKADTPDAIIKMDGAKRVQIKMLRDVDGKDLGKAFTEAMQKNMTPEDRSKTINGIFKFGQIFADIKRAPSGSNIQVDWIPGTGSQVFFDGKAAGEPIKEPEFYAALLRIWVGEHPADDNLKDAWLGKGKSR